MPEGFPTEFHIRTIVKHVLRKHERSVSDFKLLHQIGQDIHECLLGLRQDGLIYRIPKVHCTFTKKGQTLNHFMEWVDAFDYTSITIIFTDPETGKEL